MGSAISQNSKVSATMSKPKTDTESMSLAVPLSKRSKKRETLGFDVDLLASTATVSSVRAVNNFVDLEYESLSKNSCTTF